MDPHSGGLGRSSSGRAEQPRLHVSFFCTGNICRSPMADVVLRHLASGSPIPGGGYLADRLEVSSAGTGGWHAGDPMDPRARAALERRGYADHGQRARAFGSSRFGSTDLIVCMDRGHRQTLQGLAHAYCGDERYDERLVMLRGFNRRAGGAVDVPDPYYGNEQDFETCLAMIESGCAGLVDHLVTSLIADG